MPFCQHCGSEVDREQEVCLNCGRSIKPAIQPLKQHTNDPGGFGWGLLGFCIPLAGLILYLVWMNERPNSARAAGMGALISVIISVVFGIIAQAAGLFYL